MWPVLWQCLHVGLSSTFTWLVDVTWSRILHWWTLSALNNLGYANYCHLCHILTHTNFCFFGFLPMDWWLDWKKKVELDHGQLLHLMLFGWMIWNHHFYLLMYGWMKHHSSVATHLVLIVTPVEETQLSHVLVVNAFEYQQELLCLFSPCLQQLIGSEC